MSIVFIINYFLMRGDVPIDNEMFLMTDFVNLKIKLTHFFKSTYRKSVHTYIYKFKCSYIQ
jgi:hypothetical protein